jgi:hypothetical protein
MARRVVLGKVGSDFVFRVSRPGFDAATTDLSNLIFDADGVQARVAATGLATVAASTFPLTPATTTIAHGVAAPGLAIGVAQSTYVDIQNTNTGMWVGMKRQNNVANGQVTNVPLPWNDDLKIGWCTPWRLAAEYAPDGYAEANGWRIRWNNSSLFLDNFQAYGIRVRWAVLEF